jgi:Lon-like protease
VHDGAELVPEDEFNPEGLSESQRRQESLSEMSASQQIAIAVALRRLGHDVEPLGAEVASVLAGAPADGKLRVGDVIVSAKGEKVTSPEELSEVMRSHAPGTPVRFEVRRGGRQQEIVVGTRASTEGPRRAVVGIIVQPELHFPVDVKIDAGNIGGPSAGLAFALDIYDELGEDIDRGRRVVVTGTLDLNGRVGPIGGIEQKTLGARLVDADVFLVPDANAAAARRRADDDVRVIPVSTFQEALSALTTAQLSR